MYARVHIPTNTVVCLASNVKNLHNSYGDQLGLSKDYEDRELFVNVRVGDLADGTAKPENYPIHIKTPEEIREEEIQAELRAMALERIDARSG